MLLPLELLLDPLDLLVDLPAAGMFIAAARNWLRRCRIDQDVDGRYGRRSRGPRRAAKGMRLRKLNTSPLVTLSV